MTDNARNPASPSARARRVRRLAFAATLAAAWGGAFMLTRTPTETHWASAGPHNVDTRQAAPGAAPPVAVPATKPSIAKPSTLSQEDKQRALNAITRVDRPLRDYLRKYGQFPVGTNAEITRALTGANPDKVIFVIHAESPMNAAGELVDAWGTPFFFHQISGRQMEIMSAGPDRQMWNADDVKVPCN